MNTAIFVGRVSLNTVQKKKKYERVSNETALLAIFSHILPLNTTNFYALGLKKICAIPIFLIFGYSTFTVKQYTAAFMLNFLLNITV